MSLLLHYGLYRKYYNPSLRNLVSISTIPEVSP